MIEDTIARINWFVPQSEECLITDEEKKEQQKLRREYIDSVKRNLTGQLDNITVVRPDGSVQDLSKVKRAKKANKGH